MNQAKEAAKALKKEWQDELDKHRNSGNYKFEITPGDIQSVFMEGVKFLMNNPKVSQVYW